MKVLLIEDDRTVVRDVSFCLHVPWPEAEVVAVGEGMRAIDIIDSEEPDLVMLDSTLPDIEASDFIGRIREYSDVPLMVLSEGQSETENAWCLEAGADDYITKPFSPLDLIARVRVLLRRIRGMRFNREEEKPLTVGDRITINTANREVIAAGERIKLTPIEYKLLVELARGQGRVIAVETLTERVWGPDYADDSNYVKRYIYRLRQKLETDSDEPLFLSERGVGYRIAQPG